jgi:hypothetical protein
MVLWVLCLAVLGLAVLSLVRFQTAASPSGRVVTGGAAMILGVLGLVLLATLVI